MSIGLTCPNYISVTTANTPELKPISKIERNQFLKDEFRAIVTSQELTVDDLNKLKHFLEAEIEIRNQSGSDSV